MRDYVFLFKAGHSWKTMHMRASSVTKSKVFVKCLDVFDTKSEASALAYALNQANPDWLQLDRFVIKKLVPNTSAYSNDGGFTHVDPELAAEYHDAWIVSNPTKVMHVSTPSELSQGFVSAHYALHADAGGVSSTIQIKADSFIVESEIDTDCPMCMVHKSSNCFLCGGDKND